MISYCLSTANKPKDDRTFRASTSIISSVREGTFYAICVVDNDRYFKNIKSSASLQDQQEKFGRHAIYGMINGSRNTLFSWWKTPNGRVKLKTVVTESFGLLGVVMKFSKVGILITFDSPVGKEEGHMTNSNTLTITKISKFAVVELKPTFLKMLSLVNTLYCWFM